MSQAQAAAGIDRLPWLPDEPKARAKRGKSRELAGWAVAATLLIAGVSYWMGARSWDQPARQAMSAQPSTTVALPQPRLAEPPQPQVALQAPPEVRPEPQREVPIARPHVDKRSAPTQSSAAHETSSTAVDEKTASDTAPAPAQTTPPQATTPPPAAAYKPPTAWPAWQSKGAYGRIVRIGAFGSREQAKLGWRYMVEAYPAVAHLPATVIGTRNSRGQHFYRFQIGTTSQAHSEVLCQRMEKIHLSCAVVGLPWKPKGVER